MAAGRRRPGRTSAPIVRRGTLRLPRDVARRVRLGHPWVYREAIDARKVAHEKPGSPIELLDQDGEFVARGIFDGETAISVRVVTRDRDHKIGPGLFGDQVRRAIAFRRRLFDFDRDQVIRLVNAESDGVPAVVVERYGDYLVTQFYSSAAARYRDAIYDALEAEMSPAAIYEQRRYKSLGGDAPGQAAADLMRGTAAPVELMVNEGELSFAVDVTAPLSTGLFADLRLGREAVARWAKGRKVLNMFSYTGAISVYAQHGGATEVVAVDVAAKAHARARKNFSLNGFDPEKPEHLAGDALSVLEKFRQRNRTFGMAVIDPPAFGSATRGGKPWSAVRDYAELVSAVLSVVEPDGVLIAASSTRKMSAPDFDAMLADGAMRANTRLRIVERVPLPPDFPVAPGFPEGNYLKCVVAIRT